MHVFIFLLTDLLFFMAYIMIIITIIFFLALRLLPLVCSCGLWRLDEHLASTDWLQACMPKKSATVAKQGYGCVPVLLEPLVHLLNEAWGWHPC